MPQIGTLTANKLLAILRGTGGVMDTVAALNAQQSPSLAAISSEQIVAQNVAPELSERSVGSKYPLIYLYCDKILNELREKFRTFSGTAQMTVEIRVSQDRLEDMETLAQSYVDIVTQVLDSNRGDWEDGVFFGGGYEITFGGVKKGGRNFLQIAKVSFVLEISAD